MADESSEDLWSLVLVGSRWFLGLIQAPGNDDRDDIITMQPCYEVTSHLIPVGRHPDGTPIISKNISAEPVLLTWEESPIKLEANLIVHGKDMKAGDQARYKRLAADAAKMALDARAADSGLTLGGEGPGA